MTFHKKIRAMERRRYIPSTEGLEGRELMAGVNTLFGIQVTTNLNVPITLQQKEKRIEHLPYYLQQINPGRFLPKTEINDIQSALFNMIDSIDKPHTDALNNFNYQLRKVVNRQSLTAGNIALLNHGVTAVLNSANAPQASINGLSNALFTLTSQVDTASALPVVLGTNDNTLVLQTALAIGRPMPPPQLPKIKKNNGIQANATHIKTPLRDRRWSAPTITTRSCKSSTPRGSWWGRPTAGATIISWSRSRHRRAWEFTSSGFRQRMTPAIKAASVSRS